MVGRLLDDGREGRKVRFAGRVTVRCEDKTQASAAGESPAAHELEAEQRLVPRCVVRVLKIEVGARLRRRKYQSPRGVPVGLVRVTWHVFARVQDQPRAALSELSR